MYPSNHLPTIYQIGKKTSNGLLQFATLRKTNQITNNCLHHLQNQLGFTSTPETLTSKHNSNFDNEMNLLQQASRKIAQNLSKL